LAGRGTLKLLDNACKFTSSGKVTIEADWNGSQMLEVTVADTGRGIEPNRLEVVFDRFYQEEGHCDVPRSGTGLGSNLPPDCKWLGRSDLGGFRWQDQGSQFHFTIVENTQKQTPQRPLS